MGYLNGYSRSPSISSHNHHFGYSASLYLMPPATVSYGNMVMGSLTCATLLQSVLCTGERDRLWRADSQELQAGHSCCRVEELNLAQCMVIPIDGQICCWFIHRFLNPTRLTHITDTTDSTEWIMFSSLSHDQAVCSTITRSPGINARVRRS